MKGIYIKSNYGGFVSDVSLEALVEGVFVLYPWGSLQGSNGKLTTDAFYNICKRITGKGKKMLICVTCGSYSSSYLYYNKVDKIKFTQYRRMGNGPRFEVLIPDVINPVYKSTWLNFIERFLEWIKGTDLWEWVSGFKVTGLAVDTEELRLPYQTPEMMPDGKKDVTDCMEIWKERGYTEEYILEMWNETYDIYEGLCESKWLNLAVLGGQAFPCLGEKGIYAYTGANNFTKRLIRPGSAINSTALSDTGGTPFFVKGDKVGFQMEFIKYANNQVHDTEFEAMLDNGINHGAKWLEIADYNISGPGNYKLIIENVNNDMI